MAAVEVAYQTIAPGPAAARGGLADSVSKSASVFVAGLSGIAQLVIFPAPWGLLIGVLAWSARRIWPRLVYWPARRAPVDPD